MASIPKAYADLSGIDYYELPGDRNLKQTAEYVVENCGVEGTGYVGKDRLYGLEAIYAAKALKVRPTICVGLGSHFCLLGFRRNTLKNRKSRWLKKSLLKG